MKRYLTIKYSPSKGLCQFYTELLDATMGMVTPPDQASFNTRFLNGIPKEWQWEMVAHNHITPDCSSHLEILASASQIDSIIDLMKAIAAYKPETPSSTRMTRTYNRPNMSPRMRNNCPTGTKPPRAQDQEANPKRDVPRTLAKTTPAQERRSIPLCHTCSKPGYARDCPNHPPMGENLQQVNVVSVGNNTPEDQEDDTPQHEGELSSLESIHKEDPYDGPQYEPESSEAEDAGMRGIRLMLFSIIGNDDANYSVKLTIAKQLDKIIDKEIVDSLVDTPARERTSGKHKSATDEKTLSKRTRESTIPKKVLKQNQPIFDAKF